MNTENPLSKETLAQVKNIRNINILDPLEKFTKLYIFLPIIGAVIFFITSAKIGGAIIGALLGSGVAWFSIRLIATVRSLKLNFTKYPLPGYLTKEKLLAYLGSNFSHPDIQINKGLLGISFIYKNSSTHRIYLNEEKRHFSISSTMTFKSRLKYGMQVNSLKLYKNTVQVTPIILKAFEDASNSAN